MSSYNYDAFEDLVDCGNLKAVKLFLDNNIIDPYWICNNGYTVSTNVVIYSCDHKQYDILEYLLKYQVNDTYVFDINSSKVCGGSLIQRICKNGNTHILKMLLSIKDSNGKILVDLNKCKHLKCPPLHICFNYDNYNAFKTLLSFSDICDINLNLKSEDGNTILHLIMKSENSEIYLKKLLKYNDKTISINPKNQINFNLTNDIYMTAEQIGIRNGMNKNVKLLTTYISKISQNNNNDKQNNNNNNNRIENNNNRIENNNDNNCEINNDYELEIFHKEIQKVMDNHKNLNILQYKIKIAKNDLSYIVLTNKKGIYD